MKINIYKIDLKRGRKYKEVMEEIGKFLFFVLYIL